MAYKFLMEQNSIFATFRNNFDKLPVVVPGPFQQTIFFCNSPFCNNQISLSYSIQVSIPTVITTVAASGHFFIRSRGNLTNQQKAIRIRLHNFHDWIAAI